jgi:hypothetical protein
VAVAFHPLQRRAGVSPAWDEGFTVQLADRVPSQLSSQKRQFGPQTTQNDAEEQRVTSAGPATRWVGKVSFFSGLIICVFCLVCGLNCRM